MLLPRRPFYLITLCMLINISSYTKCSHQSNTTTKLVSNATSPSNQQNGSSTSSLQVDDILKDTIMLLDVLDQKLASVNNRTSSAMMKDNLRALDGAFEGELEQSQVRGESARNFNVANRDFNSRLTEEASLEEALVRLAEGFSSDRKSDDSQLEPMIAAASNHQQSMDINQNSETSSLTPDSASSSDDHKSASDNKAATGSKKSKQLTGATSSYGSSIDENQLASDSTERHIKFTLDLMQSIFSSQSYSSKTNLIESFLISPLSIQMVLMMMHLGARGQTRREISNCLHLTTTPIAAPLNPFEMKTFPSISDRAELMGSKLKRRHQQQQVSSGAEPGKQQSANGKHQQPNANLRQQSASSTSSSSQQQQQQQQQISGNAHELFGAAMRNLLKDPIVMKALTSANQIFLQKNLPLSPQYEWAIKHYYAADVKLVDFQHQSTSSSSPANGSGSSQSQLLDKGKPQSNGALDHLAAQAPSSNTTSNGSNATSADQHQKLRDEQANNIQQMINDWVERQTKGKISNFLSSPISTSTLMMAINVLYFKGDWQYKFDPSDTETDAWFTQANGKTVKIPMMVNRLPLAFAHDPIMKTSVIELPYKAQRLGLFLLLPDEVSGIFHTMQMLNSTSFANLISSMRKPSPTADQGSNGINVRIPKFSIESSPRLSQILSQQLGLKSLFMPDSADLSGMFAPQQINNKRSSNTSSSGGQHRSSSHDNINGDQQVPLQVGLDELLHKAVLQVDEQGSVAAASSATIVERVGLFNSNYFEADHPFLLFLMDKQTGLVLFSGAFAGKSNNGHSNSNPEA